MKRSRVSGAAAVNLLAILAWLPGTAEADVPVAVSPGSADRALAIERRCPTFSWGSVAGTEEYDLVVYRLHEEGVVSDPVVHEILPGTVSSWTPGLDLCLERGERYAWSIRARGVKETSGWSAPSLFQVVSGAGAAERERALMLVKRYREGGRAREPAARARRSRTGARAPTVRDTSASDVGGGPTSGAEAGPQLPAGTQSIVTSGDACCDGRRPADYATGFGNHSIEDGVDILALEVTKKTAPASDVNYIGFFDWDDAAGNSRLTGEIQGDGGGGLEFTGTADRFGRWEIRRTPFVDCLQGRLCTFEIYCHAGQSATGGGWEISGSSATPGLLIKSSERMGSIPLTGSGWGVVATNDSAPLEWRGVAVCVAGSEEVIPWP